MVSQPREEHFLRGAEPSLGLVGAVARLNVHEFVLEPRQLDAQPRVLEVFSIAPMRPAEARRHLAAIGQSAGRERALTRRQALALLTAAATARHSPSSAHRKRTAAHSAGDGQSASIAFCRIELRVTSSVKLRVCPESTKATRCAAIATEEEV